MSSIYDKYLLKYLEYFCHFSPFLSLAMSLFQVMPASFTTSHKQQTLRVNTSKWRQPNLAQFCLGLHNDNCTLRVHLDGGPCDLKMCIQQISTVFHFSDWWYRGQLLRQCCQATPMKMANSVKQFCQYWAFYDYCLPLNLLPVCYMCPSIIFKVLTSESKV